MSKIPYRGGYHCLVQNDREVLPNQFDSYNNVQNKPIKISQGFFGAISSYVHVCELEDSLHQRRPILLDQE